MKIKNLRREYCAKLPFKTASISERMIRSKRNMSIYFDGANYIGSTCVCDYAKDFSKVFLISRYWYSLLDKEISRIFDCMKNCETEEIVETILYRFGADNHLKRIYAHTYACDGNYVDRCESLRQSIEVVRAYAARNEDDPLWELYYGKNTRNNIAELEKKYSDFLEFSSQNFDYYVRRTVEQLQRGETAEKCRQDLLKQVFSEESKKALKEGLRGDKYRDRLFDVIPERLGEELTEDLQDFIWKHCVSSYHNYKKRKTLFLRKARLNRWSYFATFTYDGAKMGETAFRAKLSKELSNLAVRHRWSYMGVWERGGKDNRLHFHALIYVPLGEMVGELTLKKDFSIKRGEFKQRLENSFFAQRFGRNDFDELANFVHVPEPAIKYIAKYMSKSEERIVYARHIPTRLIKDLPDRDILCRLYEFGENYVLSDDVVEWERDIKPIRLGEQISFLSA